MNGIGEMNGMWTEQIPPHRLAMSPGRLERRAADRCSGMAVIQSHVSLTS